MKLVGVLICLLVVAMDIVAGLLGIEADIAQNKVEIKFKLNFAQKKTNLLFVWMNNNNNRMCFIGEASSIMDIWM